MKNFAEPTVRTPSATSGKHRTEHKRVSRSRTRARERAPARARASVEYDVLVSLLNELMLHRELTAGDSIIPMDWYSPTERTRVCRYGNRSSVYSIVNQVPDAVATEIHVYFDSRIVFVWKDYRWPHLASGNETVDGLVSLPSKCLKELLDYHIDASTDWLRRYHRHQNEQLQRSLRRSAEA